MQDAEGDSMPWHQGEDRMVNASKAVAGLALMGTLGVAICGSTAGAIVWPGGDDGGYLTLDKNAAKCEAKAAKNMGKLWGAILKCQGKLVANALKGNPPIDEQACENAAAAKYTAKTVTTDCPCVIPANNAATVESVLNGSYDQISCDPAGGQIAALPDNGAVQITGNVPSTKDILKADAAIAKAVGKYAAGWLKCHSAAATAYQKTGMYDDTAEETCESTNQTTFEAAFNAQMTRQGCEDLAGIEAVVFSVMESSASLNFCVQN
jgi:hypothetical protein